jgi:hypothetical protein
MKSRPECADCARCNDVMLNDNYCPWPNKDEFCRAWMPSQAWKLIYKRRLRKTCRAARTWKRMYGKNTGVLSSAQLKKQVNDIRAAVLLTRQIQVYVNLENDSMMRALDSIGCVSCQGKRKI